MTEKLAIAARYLAVVEKQIALLSELGLTGYEATAYLALLGRNSFTPTELAARAKIPRQRIYDVLESLEEKGLCISKDTSPRSYFAIAPDLALEALSIQRAEALERDRLQMVARTKELISDLSPVYQVGRGQNDPLEYIDVLGNPSRIASKALALAQTVRTRVNSCIKRPLILTKEQNWRFIREPLLRGVTYRAIYENSALEDEELRVWLTTFAEWGQQIRFIPELPIKMQAFDDDIVLLSMQDPVGSPPSFTALAIRHTGMVAMINLAFEQLWERSEPYRS
ncbi:TrmB family transcriptional regulator [Scytonema sp. HK-05]|uniref:TrmB family transcriptional regulator n=1 Tax=Scytonema sp. HK-05 TaxID=1137095 RepID=UPI001E2F1033|nr:helix-turn-helix domain-containing protein [Scytonema sp. HK-05]